MSESPARTTVAAIGGGVVGTAVARALAQHQVPTMLLEAKQDIGAGTSKANTAICHTGFDATPGTVEASLVTRGYHLLVDYARRAGIGLEPTGALLVAWDDEQYAALDGLVAKALANGYLDAERIDAADVHRLEPHLGPGAHGAVLIPGEWIIDPWSPPLCFARDALAAGAEVRRGCPVTDAERTVDGWRLSTPQGPVDCRWVVNCAGLSGDEVDRFAGRSDFTVTARRGELIVFDKPARSLVRHIVLPVPGRMGKGVLVSPTAFGNVMVGPTAVDLDRKDSTATTADGLGALMAAAVRLVPALAHEEVTATYAGLRAATQFSDYVIGLADRWLTLGGIRSTGLTASLALGEYALGLLTDDGLETVVPSGPTAVSTAPALGETTPRRWQTGGRIVCHCERVCASEIDDALCGPLAAVDLDGIRRRTRALTGRCGAFHCLAEITATAAATSGRPAADWLAL